MRIKKKDGRGFGPSLERKIMSHWTTVKTEIKDLALAGELLRQAGFTVGGSGKTIGYRGMKSTTCPLTFRSKRGDYIGGITAEGEIVWDSFGFSPEERRAVEALPQAYAKAKLQKALRLQGFSWGNEEVQADGAIRMTVRRWA